MPRHQFPLRSLLSTVAIVALFLGAVRLYQIRDHHLREATRHADEQRSADLFGGEPAVEETWYYNGKNIYKVSRSGQVLAWFGPLDPPIRDEEYPWNEGLTGLPQDDRDWIRNRIRHRIALFAYHGAMREKHAHAANRPWESIPPDPLPPSEE